MQPLKPFKIVRSRFLSEQERKLAEFCEKNNISFTKKPNADGRGINDYEIKFEPSYLDGTERHVVEYCKKNNIGYKFAVDVDGHHHYEFDKMIDMETPSSMNSPPRSYSTYVPQLKRDTYQDEINFVEYDADIEELQKSCDPRTAKPKKWYLKLLYYTYPPYFLKIRKKMKMIKSRKDYVEGCIKRIKEEKKEMRNMLVLAGLLPSDK
jgi:hypothetical protein